MTDASTRPLTRDKMLLASALIIGAAGAAAGFYKKSRRDDRSSGDENRSGDAPHWTQSIQAGAGRTIGKTISIDRPREEVFNFWKDFGNLPKFAENIELVEPTETNGRHRWTFASPLGGSIQIETEITAIRDDELIEWKSVPGSKFESAGSVRFSDGIGDRGTVVTAEMTYAVPGGSLGERVAGLFEKIPELQVRHDLKRLKMYLETGEIATADRYKKGN